LIVWGVLGGLLSEIAGHRGLRPSRSALNNLLG
jgi:hypothetical protein